MDIASGEMVEKELNAIIERRSRKGEVDPDELEPFYMESARRYNAHRREEMRRHGVNTTKGRLHVLGPSSSP